MSMQPEIRSNRREFLKTSGQLAAGSTLLAAAGAPVHAAGSDLIRLALVA